MGRTKGAETVAIRQLDQIQEEDPEVRGGRTAAMVMASFGGACVVFAALTLMRDPGEDPVPSSDPLGQLVAEQGERPERADVDEAIDRGDVTFPGVLTDQDNPTTAMEVVRDRDDVGPVDLPYDRPPPATDRLPVVPLPAQDVAEAAHRPSLSPSDTLRTAAREVAREPDGSEMAEAGHPGGYQLQVSSFKARGDADSFAMALRRRGHKAHVVDAHVKGRGLWHRVRIGPFKYRRSAEIYRQDFEAKERMVTFVVNPPETKIHIAPAE